MRDAVEAGLPLTIYGDLWAGLVPDDLVAGRSIPNDELSAAYASAGVVLNDHWPDMAEQGFVSNRLFDALSCATPVITDRFGEVEDLLGPVLGTYGSPDELRAATDVLLGDPVRARRRAEEGRKLVLAAHTFDHRADHILGLLDEHGLVSNRGGG